MKGKNFSKKEKELFARVGNNIKEIILSKGYMSPYDFWIEHGEDEFSRSNLNYLLNGRTDPKLSTLMRLSKILGVEISDFLK